MQMLGWTFEQFAKAKAHHASVTEEQLPATFAGALRLKHWWESRRRDAPLETVFEGVKNELDYQWARDAFVASPAIFP